MNPFDLEELKDAANLHNIQKANRAMLRDTHRQAREAMYRSHEKERINNPQSPDLAARQLAERDTQKRIFDEYNAKLDAHQKDEWKAFEAANNRGDDSKIEYARKFRELEIRHEKEIDATNQRHEAMRLTQKFQHLDEIKSNDPKVLAIQNAREQGLLNFQRIDLEGRIVQHERLLRDLERDMEHRLNSARAQRLDQQRADRIQRETAARERAVRESKPIVDPRVPAMLAVVDALEKHQQAETIHRDALAHQQEVPVQESKSVKQPKSQDKPKAADVPAAVKRPAFNEQQVFAKKMHETEGLAQIRNRHAGDFDETLENDRAKAKVYAAEAGQDGQLDAAARAAVERDWIPREFAFAQAEIARREAALGTRLEKINSHLEPGEKIRSGRTYSQIKGEDGALHDPSLEDIERVADRLDVLAQAEAKAREAELAHPEWLQEQQPEADPRVAAMAKVKSQIEEHRAVESKHQAAIDSRIPTEERPWRDAADAVGKYQQDLQQMNKDHEQSLAQAKVAHEERMAETEMQIAAGEYSEKRRDVVEVEFKQQIDQLNMDHLQAVEKREFEFKGAEQAKVEVQQHQSETNARQQGGRQQLGTERVQKDQNQQQEVVAEQDRTQEKTHQTEQIQQSEQVKTEQVAQSEPEQQVSSQPEPGTPPPPPPEPEPEQEEEEREA